MLLWATAYKVISIFRYVWVIHKHAHTHSYSHVCSSCNVKVGNKGNSFSSNSRIPSASSPLTQVSVIFKNKAEKRTSQCWCARWSLSKTFHGPAAGTLQKLSKDSVLQRESFCLLDPALNRESILESEQTRNLCPHFLLSCAKVSYERLRECE